MSEFDADELRLSKKQILDKFSQLERRWGKNTIDNYKYILEMKAIRIMFSVIDESKLPYFWKEYMRINDELRTENRLIAEAEENKNMQILADIQKRKAAEAVQLVSADDKKFKWGEVLKFGGMR